MGDKLVIAFLLLAVLSLVPGLGRADMTEKKQRLGSSSFCAGSVASLYFGDDGEMMPWTMLGIYKYDTTHNKCITDHEVRGVYIRMFWELWYEADWEDGADKECMAAEFTDSTEGGTTYLPFFQRGHLPCFATRDADGSGGKWTKYFVVNRSITPGSTLSRVQSAPRPSQET